jgi:hypothetical protein
VLPLVLKIPLRKQTVPLRLPQMKPPQMVLTGLRPSQRTLIPQWVPWPLSSRTLPYLQVMPDCPHPRIPTQLTTSHSTKP